MDAVDSEMPEIFTIPAKGDNHRGPFQAVASESVMLWLRVARGLQLPRSNPLRSIQHDNLSSYFSEA